MKKVLVVFGTRPEAIKMAPLVKELLANPLSFKTIICLTGQHKEMLQQVIDIFGIKADYNLEIMKAGQDLFDLTTAILMGMKGILLKEQPDMLLVHGDTSTSSSAALSAYYMQIPVAHIEAGLRTNDIYSPWPEELNRQITARIAKWHFAPTQSSRDNLLKENIKEEDIYISGNTVIDALHWVVDKINTETSIKDKIKNSCSQIGIDLGLINEWELGKKKLILITAHRRESFGEGFVNICSAIRDLAKANPEVSFLYPVHLNPNVRKVVKEILESEKLANMILVEPLEYLQFVYLMSLSNIVLTDSGGIQEEAPGLGKPVLVMRDQTERPEAVDAGTVKLVGTNYKLICEEVNNLLTDKEYYNTMARSVNPYGDGKACKRIIEILKR